MKNMCMPIVAPNCSRNPLHDVINALSLWQHLDLHRKSWLTNLLIHIYTTSMTYHTVPQLWYYKKRIDKQTKSYLCSGGSSFTTSQTGQREHFDEWKRLTSSIIGVSDTLAGCMIKAACRWYSLPSQMSRMTSFRSPISCFCFCKHLQTVGSILKIKIV